ncbi:MAG TPA: DUF4124 domain-containing protein [Burkholderiales bacterium]|nr:DUF4124 domain-containing protein [Burkholderiales bacterium]
MTKATGMILRVVVAAAALAPLPAFCAQIYKWVDERGVTNYSNHQPARATAPRGVGVVENNISVYTPDAALTRAVDAFRMRSNEIGANASAPVAPPPYEYSAPVFVPVASDPCAEYRAAGCDEFYPDFYPYAPVAGYGPHFRRHKRIPQVHIPPGTIAGQVVGTGGYIPGNSASAPRFGPPPVRPGLRLAIEPSHTGGRPAQLPARFR